MKKLSQIPAVWKLGGILVIFSALVLGNISRWSIWFDEAFTAYIVRFNFAEIYHFTSVDVHPPLYYWSVKLWTMVFGTSELGFRSMSLFFAIIGLIGLYKLTKKMFNENIGLLVTGFAALAPILIRFSDEARMYTMVFAIVMWATYLLVLQVRDRPKTWRWIVYGILVSSGMWVHYYVALAWLAHWVWRYVELRVESKKNLKKRFFSKQWLLTHALAVGLFLPWLPYAVTQFVGVQGGFWIPKLGVYTPIDYLSNGLIYQQYGSLLGWQAITFLVTAVIATIAIVRTRKYIPKKSQQGYRLFGVMAIAPPAILVILSLPPLTPSFIDRYVLSSMVFLVGLIIISLAYMLPKDRKLAIIGISLLVATMTIGVTNAYYYGNYNKNSSTSIRVKEVAQLIDKKGEKGQPIIADNAFIYYEIAFYSTKDHPVYYIDSKMDYGTGSVRMLQDTDTWKIRDLQEFASQHSKVWFITSADDAKDVKPPVASWQADKDVEAYDYINNSSRYRAILYDTTSAN